MLGLVDMIPNNNILDRMLMTLLLEVINSAYDTPLKVISSAYDTLSDKLRL
jgi:hypothetical protein